MTATLQDLLPALSADRDARVTRVHGTLACVEMDDVGEGEFARVISDESATELVALGLVRDAREAR